MVLPQPFTTASAALVNYDATDVSNGTGYEYYYLIESEDSTGKDYHLTPNNDYSNSAIITQSPAGTKDYDYDLTPFTIPKTINGDVIISIPIHTTLTYSLTCYLYKWDGTTETLLGTVGTGNITGTGANMKYMILPIENELIPAGESLRLRVVLTMVSSGTVLMGIDPAGRSDATLSITTTSKLSVPYKLDL